MAMRITLPRLTAVAITLIGAMLLFAPRQRAVHVSALGTAEHRTVPELLVVFQPGTCLANLLGAPHWNAAHEAGRIRARGLLLGGPMGKDGQAARADIASALGLRFPISEADSRAVARQVRSAGYESTPLAILLDSKGRLRVILPAARLATASALESAVQLAN